MHDPAVGEQVYRQGVDLLDRLGLTFWLEQGTLLGAIRDKRLIPWDHDIDFGVYKRELDLGKVVAAFEAAGFRQEALPAGNECLHFCGEGGYKVDLTLYETKDGYLTTAWTAPYGGIGRRLLHRSVGFLALGSMSDLVVYPAKSRGDALKNRALKVTAALVLVVPSVLRRAVAAALAPLHARFLPYKPLEFKLPQSFFKTFATYEFLGRSVRVPGSTTEYLEYAYGADWRTPKQNWTWYQESGGLKEA